jgi:hypothetical protein
MVDVLIRGLDERIHAELRRRAEAAGMSMQQYIARLLAEHAHQPTQRDWLQRLERLSPVADVTGAEAVAAARRDLP